MYVGFLIFWFDSLEAGKGCDRTKETSEICSFHDIISYTANPRKQKYLPDDLILAYLSMRGGRC